MNTELNSTQVEEVNNIAYRMLMVATTMAAAPDNQNAPSFLVQMTGQQMIEAFGDIVEIVSGTSVSSRLLADVQRDVQQLDQDLNTLRDAGVDLFSIAEEMLNGNDDTYDDHKDDMGYDD